jgi:4-amino-4-deoxy-L-arabinose transferase-like glycosyltransferase
LNIRWICLLNLALCLFTLFALTDPFYVINHEATQIAAHLVRGEGFTGSGGLQIRNAPSAILQPVYPCLLAFMLLLFKVPAGFFALRLLQALFSVLLCRMIYLIAREVFAERAALLAALLYAVYFPFAHVTTIIWDITLFSLLVSVIVYLALKFDNRRPLWLGLALGITVLTNAVSLIIFPVLLLYLGWRFRASGRRIVVNLILVGSVAALIFVPWSVRNMLLFKAFVPVRTGFWGILYLVNNEDATGTMLLNYQGKPARSVNEGVTLHYRPLIKDLINLNEEQQEQYFKRKLLVYVSAQPGRFMQNILVKMYYYLWVNPYDPVNPFWLLEYLALVVLGLFGSYQAVKAKKRIGLFLLLWGAFTGVYAVMGPLYNWKYRFPVEPYLIIMAGYGFSTLIPTATTDERPSRIDPGLRDRA